MDALLGYTGLVGSTLRENLSPDTTEYFNRSNFNNVTGRKFRDVYCACITGIKWWSNVHPIEDEENMVKILATVKSISCNRFILISTIDVHDINYMNQTEACERTAREIYGYHRKFAEDSLRSHFGKKLYIFRLPTLFGMGIKENNLFYDFLNRRSIDKINVNTCLQWYSLSWLTEDIRESLLEGRPVTNLYSEPIETKDIVEKFFPECRMFVGYGPEIFYNQGSVFGLKTREDIFESMENYIRIMKYITQPNRMVISNMAWNPINDDHAIFLMNRYGINNVNVVPTKYGSWDTLFSSMNDVPAFVEKFHQHGIRIHGFQSVLCGVPGDFSSNHVSITNHLEKVMDLCRRVDGSVIIVSSPSKRFCKNSFEKIADVLSTVQCGNDIKVCLEPNSTEYGCNVGTTLSDCMSLVDFAKSRSVDGIGFYVNFDTGNRMLENDRLPRMSDDDRLPRMSDDIGHCQVSAPFLRGMRQWDYHAFESDGTLDFFRETDDDIKVCLEVSKVSIMNLGNQISRFVNFMSKSMI